ncbi:hypothetical protein KR767_04245 [Luteibacter anthropi]|uniref:hypothetical protein n=1 Tax=Luteibacter anthropi TaxID=564369 RepID=UPI0020322853|nr:hypothetical protein [Luteibacter anthropi]URX63288.1 hypothetical protein KR767_04245 [Luteibacter anthropi]
MSGLRFAVGDLAILAVARSLIGLRFEGRPCTVRMIGPYGAGQVLTHPVHGRPCIVDADGDYLVVFDDGNAACPLDLQLRRIEPPAEPAAMSRSDVVEVQA